MFSIDKLPFGPLEVLGLSNLETNEKLEVIPRFGGVINNLTLKKSNKLHSLIQGCNDYETLITIGKETFRGSKLSPFPNRILDGKYQFEGNDYQLYPNEVQGGNALHGLIYDKEFRIIHERASEKSAEVSLLYEYEGDSSGYPFKYNITINYTLNIEGFFCTTQIENMDTRTIPIGDGWHPYFTFEQTIDELYIKIPSKVKLELNDRLIPTGNSIESVDFYTLRNIAEFKFDTCYLLESTSPFSIIEVYSPRNDLRMYLWMETGKYKYNFVQIYTPSTRDCLAIEPMTCAPNSFNNGMGLIELKPNGKIDATFGVRLA